MTTKLVIIGGVAGGAAVAVVLLGGAVAHVAAAVVEGVAIDMVGDHAGRRLHDLAMHEDDLAALAAAGGVLALLAFDAFYSPSCYRCIHNNPAGAGPTSWPVP